MQESKFFQEIQEEARVEQGRKHILAVLEVRFGRRAAAEFAPLLTKVTKTAQLDRLLRLAARSTAVEQFRDRLAGI